MDTLLICGSALSPGIFNCKFPASLAFHHAPFPITTSISFSVDTSCTPDTESGAGKHTFSVELYFLMTLWHFLPLNLKQRKGVFARTENCFFQTGIMLELEAKSAWPEGLTLLAVSAEDTLSLGAEPRASSVMWVLWARACHEVNLLWKTFGFRTPSPCLRASSCLHVDLFMHLVNSLFSRMWSHCWLGNLWHLLS